MKKRLPYFLLFVIVFTSVVSCKKYPDGPVMSIISRKERLANTWHLSAYYENGVDKTADFNNTFRGAVLTIDKSGGYSLNYVLFGITAYNETGTWRFTNNDAYFETNPSTATGSPASHYILRLKEKELWYEDTESNGTVRKYHLIP